MEKRKIAHHKKNNNVIDNVCDLELIIRETFLAQGSLKFFSYLIPFLSCGIQGAIMTLIAKTDYSPPG